MPFFLTPEESRKGIVSMSKKKKKISFSRKTKISPGPFRDPFFGGKRGYMVKEMCFRVGSLQFCSGHASNPGDILKLYIKQVAPFFSFASLD